MAFWDMWRGMARKTAHGTDPKDTTFPEDKGAVTKESIQGELQGVEDAKFTVVKIGEETGTLIYLTTMVDVKVLQNLVLDPLSRMRGGSVQDVLKTAELVPSDDLPKLVHDIVSGWTALLLPKRRLILKINTFSAPQRSIDTTENETTVLGPQDAFTETLQTNLSLIKRRIRSPQLKHKTLMLGTDTRNEVAVIYMQNLANQENVERVIHRLQNVEYTGFFGLAVLKQMIEDKPYSPFPQFMITSRPDHAIQNLLDGRVAVIMNGSPEAVLSPASFFEMFMSPEDMYNRWTTASLLRTIRFGGFFITVLLTSSYVSVLTYHPEMLPPALLTLLSESRSKVPFPPVIEVLLIELTIEVLREAGARMPSKIGQTLGIVGGIVIGTAAVEAGLASNILIVLVAISALLSFLPTNYLMSNASRFVRYVFIIAAGFLGMFGQALALAWLMAHLSAVTSLGTPYLSPVPRTWSDISNSILRVPLNYMMKRSGVSRAKRSLTRPTGEE
ncbi:spore germination protein [Tumebacillus avium]|nr:spore germination protein [Tumebacillus avium]